MTKQSKKWCDTLNSLQPKDFSFTDLNCKDKQKILTFSKLHPANVEHFFFFKVVEMINRLSDWLALFLLIGKWFHRPVAALICFLNNAILGNLLFFFPPEWHLGSKLSLQCYRNAQGKIWPAGSQADVHNYVQRGSSQREEVILGWAGNQRWVSVIVWVFRGLQFFTWWHWWAQRFHFVAWSQYLGLSHDVFQVFPFLKSHQRWSFQNFI